MSTHGRLDGLARFFLRGVADESRDVVTRARLLGVTYRAASLNLQKLVDAGIVREATGRERNRVFTAPEILSPL